mgnify:CR=1 FL=1
MIEPMGIRLPLGAPEVFVLLLICMLIYFKRQNRN